MRRYDGIAENGDSVLFLAIANKDVAVEQRVHLLWQFR